MAKLDKRLKYQSDDEKPVTISMRLPKELHTRLEQYATQHHQSVSELVRDGLEWRLGDGDPRGLGDTSTKDDKAYYMSNTANALADMRQALARQEAQIQAIVQALERQTGIPHPSMTHNGQTESVPEPARTTGGPRSETRQTAQVPAPPGEGAPPPRGGMRQPVLDLLGAHPEGLSAEQIRAYLQPARPLGDTLQGMRRQGKVRTSGQGKAMRYFVA
jgi:hypothetical protein